MMKYLLIYLCFFFSGISALIYQVVWVREFGNIFGNSVYSASIVIAVFMTGLGVGSYLVGRWADSAHQVNPHRPLKAYAVFELGIAIFGVLIALALPLLEGLSASISSYQLNGQNWNVLTESSLAYRYILAIIILAPSTILMGGTLTLLIRFVVGNQLDKSCWRVGTLYGINTLGAAFGAFAVDFFLVPNLGLHATQIVAVSINFIIAIAILNYLKSENIKSMLSVSVPSSSTIKDLKSPVLALNYNAHRLVLLTALTIFLSGFAAMGMEIVWFRVLSSIFGQYRAIFSILLMIILIGMWLGSVSGAYLHRKVGHANILYILSLSLFVVSAVSGMLIVDADLVRDMSKWFAGEDVDQAKVLSNSSIKYSLLTLATIVSIGLPAVMMGFAYPLANANVQRIESQVGRRSGIMYFSNTMGAVAGSVVTAFYLLPMSGSVTSVSILMIISLSAIIPLVFSTRTDSIKLLRWQSVLITTATIVPLVFVVIWYKQPENSVIFKSFYSANNIQQRALSSQEGILETVVVVDDRDKHKGKVLFTNGHSMSSTSFGAQRYMRAFVHVPLLQIEKPTDVLVICFGVGNTLHATTLHKSLKNIDIVDLSENVLNHAGYFSDTNYNALEDDRVNVYVNDGRQHLRMYNDERYDLITLEPPPIVFAGVSALYSEEFYRLAFNRLKQGGFVTQWLPYTQTSKKLTYSMIKAFTSVFPDAVMLAGSNADFILLGRKGLANTINPVQLRHAMEDNPQVKEDLDKINMGTLTEFLGSFLSSQRELSKLDDNKIVSITDDMPLMEYASLYERQRSAPIDVINVWSVLNWCPDCAVNGKPIDELSNLPVFMQVMEQMFKTGRFSSPNLQFTFKLNVKAPKSEVEKAFNETPYLLRITNKGHTMQ